jgi:hypothetical protein
MRKFEMGSSFGSPQATVKIDSGWTHHGVLLDIQTSRGQTVELTVEDWRELTTAVEDIIKHCETERIKQLAAR